MNSMAGARVLVIEDEPAIADTLVYALRTEGFVPEWRASGRDGLAAFAEGAFALVVLDVGLPDVNGFDVCRELRARAGTPVLFLTARSSEVDRVVGLELGGDDYVTKPFSPREVTARVRAILRRTQLVGGESVGSRVGEWAKGIAPDDPTDRGNASPAAATKPVCHVIGYKVPGRVELEVDKECKVVRVNGGNVELTRYEFRLLAVLAGRPGRVWSRDELMAQVWEDPGASLDRTVDAHVKTVRAKLRAAGAGEDWIQTHRGEGYSWRVPSA